MFRRTPEPAEEPPPAPSAEPDSASWSVSVRAPLTTVWEAVVTPGVGNAPGDERVRDAVMPGTGPGEGEIWLSALRFPNGRTILAALEVVTWQPPRRVRLRGVTTESLQATVEYVLVDHGTGEVTLHLTHRLESIGQTAPTSFARRLYLADQSETLGHLRDWAQARAPR